MARYLVIAYQTAEQPALIQKLKDLGKDDQEARFALLIPATAAQHLQLVSAGESKALARKAAWRARSRFRDEGIQLVTVRVRKPNPVVAISEELMADPSYDGIVISTFPPGVSRWLKMDILSRVQRLTSIPVIHVVAQPKPPES